MDSADSYACVCMCVCVCVFNSLLDQIIQKVDKCMGQFNCTGMHELIIRDNNHSRYFSFSFIFILFSF